MKKFIILILILSSFFFIKNVNAGATDVFSYNWYGEQRFTSLDNPSSYIQRCFLINSNINDNSFVYAYYNNYVYVLFYNSDLEYFDYMFNVKKIEDNSNVGKIYCRFQISSDVISLNAKSDVFNRVSDFQSCYNNGNCYISNDVVEYYLPSSVMGYTMPIAEEHLGYSADILQGNNLASLSSQLKKSTIWYFWWD